MAQLSKQEAVSLLKKVVERAKGTSASNDTEWTRTARVTLAKVFGNPSAEVREFTGAIAFSTKVGLVRSMLDEVESFWDETPTRIKHESIVLFDPAAQSRSNVDSRIVFVVHGRNLGRRDALFRFLRSIGLLPLEWSQAIQATGKASPYIGEVLDAAFAKAQAVVVLLTPDDKAYLRSALRKSDDPSYESKLTYQARPNVLFEAGMAMGRSAERTILVQLGELRPFSDIGGRHVIKLDNSTESRQELAQRLKVAGCAVDLTGTQWHREGDFNLLADEPMGKP